MNDSIPNDKYKSVRELQRVNKIAFLEAFAKSGIVAEAARHAGVSRSAHHQWMHADPEYAAAFLKAREEAITMLEDVAVTRAIAGWDEVVVAQAVDADGNPIVDAEGKPVRREIKRTRKMSNTLLIFLLKAANPQKYRDYHTVENAAGEGFVQAVAELVSRHMEGAALDQFRGDLVKLLERAGRTPLDGDGNGGGMVPSVRGNGNGNGRRRLGQGG